MAETKKVLEAKLAILKTAFAKKVTQSLRDQIADIQKQISLLEE